MSEIAAEGFMPLQSLKDEVAPLQSLKDDVAPLQSLKDDVAPLQSAKDDGAPLQSAKDDVAPLQSAKDDGASAMKAGEIPVIIVIGETGSGKSTALNRMSSDFGGKDGGKFRARVKSFDEGDGAAAGTDDTRGKLLGWKGGVEKNPVFFVDTPGLNDPQGRDIQIIRQACTFLSELEHPYASQFVLVVDASNPRM
jgi:predicted GTPase